ncbi:MAG TPA: hypothetical protein VK116_09625, partial [Planctomycetota bacterium]|nr:hypothetical protein [Planctomycetota bacterium]
MKPSSVARRVVLVGALAFSRLAVATPEFTFIGDLPGGSIYSVAMGVSADGKYVVGGSSSELSGPINVFVKPTEAFLWDETNGMVPLGDLPGGNFVSLAYSVTKDGNVVVGTSEEFRGQPVVRSAPFIWTRSGGMSRLGPALTHTRQDGSGIATAIASDGRRAIGSMLFLYFGGGLGDSFASRGFFWDSFNPYSTLSIISTPAHNFEPAASVA